MANKTKADELDIDVEAALEQALDFEFDDEALDRLLATRVEELEKSEQDSDPIAVEADLETDFGVPIDEVESHNDEALFDVDLETLEQQIARAAQELVDEQQNNASQAQEDIEEKLPASTDAGLDTNLEVKDFNTTAKETESAGVEVAVTPPAPPRQPLIVAKKLGEPLDRANPLSPTPVTGAEEKHTQAGQEQATLAAAPLPAKGGTVVKKNRAKRRVFSSYWATTALSALWAGGGVATGLRLAPEGSQGLEAIASFLTGAPGMLVAAGTVVPIAMFWGFAQLARRARELKDVVEDMTDAALRLLEPESEAQTRVASLGAVIRTEVEAMGDGIERTMSRASELEALLQNEVNNLEQAYGENESRIRALIAELANEREAVSTHADHVKTTISGAKNELTREFNSIADHINATAESFTSALSETLNARWSELVNEFNLANEDVAQQLSQKFVETVHSFDASRGRFFEELDSRFAQIDQHTEEASKAVATRLGAKMDDFVKIVHERTEDVEGRFNALTGRLAHSGEKIIEAVNDSVTGIENRSTEIDNRLRSTADKVLGDFESKFDHLDREISARGSRSLTAFGEQIARLEKRATELPVNFDKVTEKAVDDFATHITRVEEKFSLLSGRLAKSGNHITDAIENSLADIEERSEDVDVRLQRTTSRILDEFEKKFTIIDQAVVERGSHSLEQFGAQIDRIEKKANDLTSNFDVATNLAIQAFEKRLNQVDESLNEHSTSLIRSFIARTESLEESTNKLNVALDVHVGRINEAFQSRTHDIAQTLTGGRDGILSVVEETKVRLSHEMEIVGDTIARLVDERAGGFIHQFSEGREKLSNTLEHETKRIVDTVSEQITLLSRHVGEIEGSLASNLGALDDKAQAQIAALNERTQNFEQIVVRNFDTAREVIETQAHNLDARGDALRDSLEVNSQALSRVLNEQAEIIEKRIAHIRDLIASGNVSFGEALGQHVALVEGAVASNDEALRQIFLQQLQNLENQTARLKDSFGDAQGALAVVIDDRIETFRDRLYSSQAAIEATLSNHGQLVSDKAHSLQNTLIDNLGRVAGELESHLMEAQTNLVGRVSGAQMSLVENLSETEKRLVSNLAQSQDNLVTTLTSADERLGETMGKADEKLAETLSTVDARLIRALSVVDEKLEHQGRLMDKRAINLRDAVDHNNEVLEKAFETQTAIIDERTVTMQKALEVGVTNVRQVLEQNAVSLSETLRERVADVSQVLAQESQQAESLINTAGQRLSQSVLASVGDVERKLIDRADYLRDSMNEIGGQIDNDMTSIVKRVANTASSLTDEAQKAETIISSAGLRLAGSVIRAAESVEQQFVERDGVLKTNIAEIEGAIESGLDAIGARMAQSASSFTQEAKEVERQINTGLDLVNERMNEAASTLSAEVHKIENQINSGLDQISQRMGSAASSLGEEARRAEGMISSAGERLSGSVVQAAEKVEQKLSDRAVFLKENVNLIEERISSGLNSIEGRISEITQKTANQLIHKTQDLHGLTEQLHVAATKTSDSLGHLTTQFSEKLKDVTRAAEERLRSENDNFISNFSSASEAAVEAVRLIKSNISDSIAQLLDRLDTSNGTIQLTVNALRSSVNEVDERLGNVASEFKQNINLLSENFNANSEGLNRDLQRFSGLSQEAVTHVEKFSQQFENHARILSEATNLLDSSHGVFAEKIEGRQNALNTLAHGLVEKSEEIAQSVQACEQIISTVMKRTEEGARNSSAQIQASMSEMITEASNRFEGATEEIRKSAEEIREELARTRADLSRGVRTLPSQTKEYTEAMRKAVVEQIDALRELSSIVEQSGRLFDVSNPGGTGSGDLYGGSATPKLATRAILPPEAAVTLPQTSPRGGISMSAADTMVPTDLTLGSNPVHQGLGSSGLNTPNLGAVGFGTGNQTGSVFSASAGIAGFTPTSANAAARPIMPTHFGDTSVGSTLMPSTAIQGEDVATDTAVAVQPRPVNSPLASATASTNSAKLSPNRHGAATSNTTSNSPTSSSSRSGWVSDLLARASRDDADKNNPKAETSTPLSDISQGETLNSMSADIVQGIDHEAIAQLWQHYRRGQRNINAAKLYTEEGVKTFEKIKHKYALDGEFRRAVSQYITDFERLLGDVSKNGGNNNTMREYLTSETGKVYTMLAHASGRIQ